MIRTLKQLAWLLYILHIASNFQDFTPSKMIVHSIRTKQLLPLLSSCIVPFQSRQIVLVNNHVLLYLSYFNSIFLKQHPKCSFYSHLPQTFLIIWVTLLPFESPANCMRRYILQFYPSSTSALVLVFTCFWPAACIITSLVTWVIDHVSEFHFIAKK